MMFRKLGFKIVAIAFMLAISGILGITSNVYAKAAEPPTPGSELGVGPEVKGKLVLTRDCILFIGKCKHKHKKGDDGCSDDGSSDDGCKKKKVVAFSTPLFGAGDPEGTDESTLEGFRMDRAILPASWAECQKDYPVEWFAVYVTRVKKLKKIDIGPEEFSDIFPGADILTADITLEYIIPDTP